MTCTACPFYITCRTPCLQGTGNKRAKLVLIGDAPGFNEDIEGIPLVGQAGDLLNFVLDKLGLKRESLFITNVIKCRPPKNELPKGAELAEIVSACQKHIRRELCGLKPKVVVLLGGTSLYAMAHQRFITKTEGCVIESPLLREWKLKTKVVAAFHPAYVLRSPSKEPNLARALAKAATLAGLKVNPKPYEETGVFDYDLRS